jgi:hypothetical protein
MPRNLRQQHERLRVRAAPDLDAKPMASDRDDFVVDEVKSGHHALL